MWVMNIFSDSITGNYLIRLLVASALGGVIGFERDIHGRAAGLRTNLLVSLGSALFMLISEIVAVSYSTSPLGSALRSDPGRIAAQIIAGIGFLGAGAIIKYGFSIRGLTTAACLWITAGIGMSAGAGLFELAIVTTLIGLFSLIVLNRVEKFYAKDSYRTLEVVTSNKMNISDILNVVERDDLSILYLDKERNYEDDRMLVRLTLRLHHKGVTDEISYSLVKDLEKSGYPIYMIKWWHQ